VHDEFPNRTLMTRTCLPAGRFFWFKTDLSWQNQWKSV